MVTPEIADKLARNLAAVNDRIAAAAQQSGRQPSEVKLVAVTKYVDAATTRCLIDAGCRDLGESRPQQLWEKVNQLSDGDLSQEPIRWHLIGHLQRNKVNRTLPLVHLVHSIDSARLLASINSWADQHNQSATGLIEVNISGDASKHGFTPDQVLPLFDTLAESPHVNVTGLMAMASRGSDASDARQQFAALRELREQAQARVGSRFSLHELSMGMSRDYPTAIEEGATLVRVGSVLFDGIEL